MKCSIFRLLVSALLAVLLGCGEDTSSVQPADPGYESNTLSANTVELPAGSVDGMAAAIAAAGNGGTVVVKAGNHTESASVLIDKKVSIVGETGAVLVVDTDETVVVPSVVDPALYVFGAADVEIRNLEIRPQTAPGGTGILLDQAPRAKVVGNRFYDHQYTILIERSDHVWIEGNHIESTQAWMTGEIPDALGITVINGRFAQIGENTVSGALFGIWACDANGRAWDNTASGNLIGIILCRVPDNSFEYPDGHVSGAEKSAVAWTLENNTSRENLDAGYLLIDGSNRNHLANNAGGDNGTYDIELVGDSYRFGFLTPTSRNNVVTVGHLKALKVKDCGVDNILIAPDPVDVNVDPCY